MGELKNEFFRYLSLFLFVGFCLVLFLNLNIGRVSYRVTTFPFGGVFSPFDSFSLFPFFSLFEGLSLGKKAV